MITTPLNGQWTLTSAFLSKPCVAHVPGSIYTDLLQNHLIDDPFDQDNEMNVRDVMNNDFTYTRNFTFSLLPEQHRHYLVFEGIDTLASIYLNNQLVATTDNMHRTYRFEVGSFLKRGVNEIIVTIHSPNRYIAQKEQECTYNLYQAHDAMKGYSHLRKGHSMFGWDWGPQLPDGGLWKNVSIESITFSKISDVDVLQSHHDTDVELAVTVRTEIVKRRLSLKQRVILRAPDGSLLDEQESPIISNRHYTFIINHPQKWYPVGYGNQPLYHISVQIRHENEIIDEKSMRIGLRDVHVKRENDAYGQSFTFVINGIEVFAKGADYIPEDNLLGRTSLELTRDLLQSAVDAHHNMVRVWGGGIYPFDYFYDLCDELGLMVWQDLMFACSVYDMTNQTWVDSMRDEIIDNITRLRHHPSLSLICGNNENETAIEFWNVPNPKISKVFYKQQYLSIIPKLLKKLAPSIDYWPSSPSSGTPFKNSNSDHYGDMHYWGVWHNNEPIAYYRHYRPRFMSEFGLQSFPALETIKTFARESDFNIFSYIMEKHQKNRTANDKILNYIGKMFQYPKDFESLLYVSQLIQAEGIRYGVEHWRRHYGECMGALYWQLNDCWPVASWSSIDYEHRWKVLHYHSKKFFQPVLVSIMEEGHHAEIYLTNDLLEPIKGDLIYEWIDFSGRIEQSESQSVALAAQSASKFFDLNFDFTPKDAMNRVLIVRFIQNQTVISENQVSFVPDKHLKLTKPAYDVQLEKEADRWALTITASVYAKYVELALENQTIRFSDNYFFLQPNRSKTIFFSYPGLSETILSNLRIRSLVDSY